MRFRKLRIAWSVAWGIACVLLIVLWVRSYWWVDTVSVNTLSRGWAADITSWDGRLRFSAYDKMPMTTLWEWRGTSEDVERRFLKAQMEVEIYRAHIFNRAFCFTADPNVIVHVPQCIPVFVFASLSIIPLVTWRFSLRTLLIATTLVAAVLGSCSPIRFR
jgi:hypothetical protein